MIDLKNNKGAITLYILASLLFFIIAIVLFFAIIGIIHYKTFVVKNETSVENDVFILKQENIVNETRLDSDIVEIAVENSILKNADQ